MITLKILTATIIFPYTILIKLLALSVTDKSILGLEQMHSHWKCVDFTWLTLWETSGRFLNGDLNVLFLLKSCSETCVT